MDRMIDEYRKSYKKINRTKIMKRYKVPKFKCIDRHMDRQIERNDRQIDRQTDRKKER